MAEGAEGVDMKSLIIIDMLNDFIHEENRLIPKNDVNDFIRK